GPYECRSSPGVLTMIMRAMVAPRNTSSETSRGGRSGLRTVDRAMGLIIIPCQFKRRWISIMPISQRGVGRDHNPGAMSVFMTGARIQGGQHIGRTDDLGYKVEEQPVTNHDLHATLYSTCVRGSKAIPVSQSQSCVFCRIHTPY